MADFNNTIGVFDNTSEDIANYARLLCLVVEEGTEKMKDYVLGHLPQKLPLDEALSRKKKTFEQLRHRNFINQKQFNELFPISHVPINESSLPKFDMSLWYLLVRNLAENKPKINFQRYEKDRGPTFYDTLPQHDIIRIRNLRNYLVHLDAPKIETATFDNLWVNITEALIRLGTEEDKINEYKTKDLDPLKTVRQYMNLREQVYTEYESLYKSELTRRKHIMIMIVISACLISLVFMVATYVLYLYSKTWLSCVHHMTLVYSTSQVTGSISFMSRQGWGAKPHDGPTTKITHYPLNYVIISHSAVSGRCLSTDDCCNMAQIVQQISFHYKKLSDVGYNYMVGNDGVIYEGRGRYLKPAIAKNHNNDTIGIGFMGTYVNTPPTDVALDATQGFLQYLVDQGILDRNFTIYGLCQVRDIFPDAPGAALMNRIRKWHGHGSKNLWSWRPGGYKCDNATDSSTA